MDNETQKTTMDFDKEKFFSILFTHIRVEIKLDKMKMIVIGMVLLFFGMTAVTTQLYLPELLEMSGLEIVNLPEASMKEVFVDFWGDTSFIGGIIVIIYGMSSFSGETNVNKTVYFFLSRPISRKTYYLTRFILKMVQITLIFVSVSVIIYLYGSIFFEVLPFDEFMMACILVTLMLDGILAVVMMISSKFSTSTTSMIGFGFLIVQMILSMNLFINASEALRWISPVAMAGYWMDLLNGEPIAEAFVRIIGLLLWIIIPGLIGYVFYSRRDL